MTQVYVVVGAGTAGCVIAARLSEDADRRVILIEAGRDFTADAMPADMAASYAGQAMNNHDYFWRELKAARLPSAAPVKYEQARVIGGGSSINGQVALRGAPADYDRWEELGAAGWNWKTVFPYFRRLENDLDFDDEYHGRSGPLAITRIPPAAWDGYTKAVVAGFEAMGFTRREDMNGRPEAGYGPLPLANDGRRRASSATAYLTAEVRARPNLTIMTEAEAERIVFAGQRAAGVLVRRGGRSETVEADQLVLTAGALHTPYLLMKSGVGPGAHLAERGIAPVLDLPGVGQNLQDHPTVSVLAYLEPTARRHVERHNFVALAYSSQGSDTPEADMVMSVLCRTAWHALGRKIGALSTYVGKPHSRGQVRLGRDGENSPEVTFNWLADDRDARRAARSFHLMVDVLRSPQVAPAVQQIFAANRLSPKLKKVNRLSTYNRVVNAAAGMAMDASPFIRRLLIDRVASDGNSVDALLADEDLLIAYLRSSATGVWHPSGTCRMGATDEPASVVDPAGRVIGLDNVSIADASVMPEIPKTNLNLPTTMVAERIADLLRGRAEG